MKTSMRRSKQIGFTLVELMVAMVLGLIVLGGTISVFIGTLESTRLNQALAQLQSNSLFASHVLSNDLRMAGFLGCSPDALDSLIVSAANAPTESLGVTAINAAVVNEADWAPGKPANYTEPTAAGAPLEGSHVLMVQYAVAPGNRLLESMNGRGSTIELAGNNDELSQGQFAVISNCNNGELFSIGYAGNSADGMSVSPAASLSQAYLYNETVPESVRVMPFRSVMYYVGSTSRINDSGDQINSLYQQTLPFDLAKNPPLEIIEGVDQLRLSMGVRDGEDYVFHAPDSATLEFTDVDLVKVGLLMATRDRYNAITDDRSYFLADTLVVPEGTGVDASYPDDGRIRIAYNLSVNIRNQPN